MSDGQLQLIPYEYISPIEMTAMVGEIRQAYWFIRNLRGGKFTQAKLRRYYRKVEAHKKKLMLAGIEKRQILDLLACCRHKCSARKQPFSPCKYCCSNT